MKHFLFLVISLLGVQLLLVGCGSGPRASQSSPTATAEFIIDTIPTPKADSATVSGIFKWTSGTGSEAAPAAILSLGQVLLNDQGTPSVAQLDSNTKLRTLTDKNGRFVFVDVPAGKYVLVFDRIIDAFMLKDPHTGEDFVFTATAGQIVDLGELVFDKIP